MAKRMKNLSDAELVSTSRKALENTLADVYIAEQMAMSGFDETLINEGMALVTDAEAMLTLNEQESRETIDAKKNFDAKYEQLDGFYDVHRKKAKVLFRNDPYALTKLDLAKAEPRVFESWMNTVETFYIVSSEDAEIQQKLARLKIDAEAIAGAQTLISEVKAARRLWENERVEDQDATNRKKAAVKALDDWMREFLTVAKIMLEDRPELLEKLGFLVKS
jgi:hypothetical protein